MQRNDPCWCGSKKKWKKCHWPIKKTPLPNELYRKKYGIYLKSRTEIEKIRQACQFAREVLEALIALADVGVTTNALNALSDEMHRKRGAIPAALNYGSPPFPKGICTSLNEVICHGIPNDEPLQEGDIVNIDVASIVEGYFGDLSATILIGKVSEEKKRLVDCTKQCLMQAIDVVKPGTPLLAIGEAISDHAEKHGYSVVNQFVGHGVGCKFHEPPQIYHHRNPITTPLAAGMIFTIEPMINLGCREAVIDTKDQWTARTADGKPSAQFEHTILVTETGHEILTAAVE